MKRCVWFWSAADAHDPLMSGYFAAVVGAIQRHDGVVSDMIGDGLLCIWTAPEADAAVRTRACLAAVELTRAVERFNTQASHRLPTRIGLNAGYNAYGQGCRANVTIGRAVRLALMNIGGGLPGSGDRATQGSPAKIAYCVAENEADNPWEPLHAEAGFPADVSVVTAFHGVVVRLELV